MSIFTSLERQVLQKLLAGDDEILSVLREQLHMTSVGKREMTGVGFFTTLVVSPEARRLSASRTFKFGDVAAQIPGLAFGAGFLLYVENGVLHLLEGYAYDEQWPPEIVSFELSYITGGERDLVTLLATIHGEKK